MYYYYPHVNTHLYGQAGCGLIGTHMPFRVVANPVAAFLFLTNDLWPTALHRYSGVPSRVCCGFSIMAHTTEGGGGIYVVLTTADKACGWLMGLMMMNGWRITFSSFQMETDMCLKTKALAVGFSLLFPFSFPISKIILLFFSSLHFLLFFLLLPLLLPYHPFFLDCLKGLRLTGVLLFCTFQTCFLSLRPLFSYLPRTSIMALNISLHLLLSPPIYILLLPPSSTPMYASLPLQYSCLGRVVILSLYCQKS